MTIELAKDVELFVREQIRATDSSDPDALVNDLLRSLKDQQQKAFPTSPELEAWLLEAADKPATPLTAADFEAIRRKARDRAKQGS